MPRVAMQNTIDAGCSFRLQTPRSNHVPGCTN